MKMAGKILSQIKKKLIFFLKEGISTGELDLLANKFIKEYDVISAFKNYDGFPGYICTSVNDAIVHGVPSDKEILKTGDIITIDLGIKYQGYFVDAAWTYAVGDIPDKTIKLLKDTQEAKPILQRSIFGTDGLGEVCLELPEHGCTDDRWDERAALQGRVTTRGSSAPPRNPPGITQDHRHRAGQSAGHFLDCDRYAFGCVCHSKFPVARCR
ncbi:MAG: M24 family metallopeptidase [Candidatus Phytoplasma australasiaticum]|nr:M24 family metallopeptidase [Candidatus Phytoplasma australasiaticum]